LIVAGGGEDASGGGDNGVCRGFPSAVAVSDGILPEAGTTSELTAAAGITFAVGSSVAFEEVRDLAMRDDIFIDDEKQKYVGYQNLVSRTKMSAV
jgi:hypothetical protein